MKKLGEAIMVKDEDQQIPSTVKVVQLMAAIWSVTYLISRWKPKKTKSQKISEKEKKILDKESGPAAPPAKPRPGRIRL
jgi:hypothetical protein